MLKEFLLTCLGVAFLFGGISFSGTLLGGGGVVLFLLILLSLSSFGSPE